MAEYIINSEDYALGMATIPYLREEIVRCRDCKWLDIHSEHGACCKWFYQSLPTDDGFCAWGEQVNE